MNRAGAFTTKPGDLVWEDPNPESVAAQLASDAGIAIQLADEPADPQEDRTSQLMREVYEELPEGATVAQALEEITYRLRAEGGEQ